MNTNTKLCTPALLYFVIAAFSIIMAFLQNVPSMYLAWKIFFALLWTWFLNFLCKKGYKAVSWFLVLLPFVLILLGVLGMSFQTTRMSMMRSIQLENFAEGADSKKKVETNSKPPAPAPGPAPGPGPGPAPAPAQSPSH